MNREAGKFGPEYVLITDSQEILAVCESIGKGKAAREFGFLYVLLGEGEYTEVWASEQSVPYTWTQATRIDNVRAKF